MKISGSSTLESPVDKVWEAIQDPAVLARCLPGCESLAVIGEDRYAMSVTAGVAAIKGTYAGEVSLSDKVAPSSLTMRASGAGAPGTIDADVKVQLAPSADGGTELSYDADASVGGAIGGVGQRMLAGVTKKMAGDVAVERGEELAGHLLADTGEHALSDAADDAADRRVGVIGEVGTATAVGRQADLDVGIDRARGAGALGLEGEGLGVLLLGEVHLAVIGALDGSDARGDGHGVLVRASPAPLRPRGLSGLGVSRWSVSMCGTSEA